MADSDILSIDEMTELVVASFANLLPDKNIGRNSDNWKRCRVLAGAITDLHLHLSVAERDSMPDTAGEATLARHGVIYGVIRRGATAASGAEAGRVRGVAGSSWTTSDVLVHRSGLLFRAATSGTLDVTGEALVGIVATDVGPTTRLTAGETLVWATPPVGLENEVALEADLDDGGESAEPIGEYRTRILDRIKLGAMGGNANDWKSWTLDANASIKGAYVYPNRDGLGSVDVAALKAGRGDARLLDAIERTSLLAYLQTKRPVTARVRVLEVVTQAQDVEVLLEEEAFVQYARDWDDRTPLEVAAWSPVNRVLEFNTIRPPSMAVGHRVIVGGTSGLELEIEALMATDAVVLRSSEGEPIAVDALVYSGGPLVEPVREAILELFDDLGPRVGPFGYGDWEGSLRLSKLFSAVQHHEGVLDSTIVEPVGNVEPTAETWPDDEAVAVLVPGTVRVRYAG